MNNQFSNIPCYRCKGVPYIKIVNNHQLYLNCDCGYNTIMNITDYIKETRKKDKQSNEDICKHHHRNYLCYCKNCHLHICKECIKDHISHKRYGFSNLLNINKLMKSVEDAYNHINVYFKSINAQIINKYIAKINEINSEYEKSLERNNSILLLVKGMLNAFNVDYPNYVNEQNILHNCNINIYYCSKTSSSKSITEYIRNYSIIKKNESIPLTNIKLKK